jgi:hypothetical protein
MQQINLYNPAFEQRRELLSLPGLALVWGSALALVVGALVLTTMRGTSLEQSLARQTADRAAAQAQLGQLAAQAAGRKPDPALAESLRNLEADLASRKQVMATLGDGVIGDTRGFSEHLKAFARQSFDGLWLTGITVQRRPRCGAGGPCVGPGLGSGLRAAAEPGTGDARPYVRRAGNAPAQGERR